MEQAAGAPLQGEDHEEQAHEHDQGEIREQDQEQEQTGPHILELLGGQYSTTAVAPQQGEHSQEQGQAQEQGENGEGKGGGGQCSKIAAAPPQGEERGEEHDQKKGEEHGVQQSTEAPQLEGVTQELSQEPGQGVQHSTEAPQLEGAPQELGQEPGQGGDGGEEHPPRHGGREIPSTNASEKKNKLCSTIAKFQEKINKAEKPPSLPKNIKPKFKSDKPVTPLNIKLKPAALILKKPALTPTTVPPKTPPPPQTKQQVKPTGTKPKTKKPDPKEAKKQEISPEKNQPTVREFFHPKPKEYKPIPRIAPPKLHLGSNHTPENTPKIPTNSRYKRVFLLHFGWCI